jgi:hypothetical protein
MLIVCLPKLSRLGSVFHLTDFRRGVGGCGGGKSESVDMMQGVLPPEMGSTNTTCPILLSDPLWVDTKLSR